MMVNARTSRPAPLDSGSMPLEGKRLMKFDPQISMGTIIQIVVVVCSAFGIYAGLREDQRQTKSDLDQVKAVAVIERAQTAQAIAEIKLEMKEQGKSLGDIKEGIAILRGRSTEPGGRK